MGGGRDHADQDSSILMADDKVSIAVLKTLLAGFKEKLGELYRGQADFLKEWPAHVSKLAAMEARLEALEQKLTDYIEAQRWSWTTIIAVASLIMTLILLWWDMFGHKGGG